ncbi:MAG TPA: O-antigen ligase family protein [Vicinamibacterales bacterium]|nr:O-antigen ligase family protein [Vicinamibacterales bacterium]
MAVAAALAWSVFAFGAVYPWAAPPLLVLAAAALWLARARPDPRDIIDAAALAALAVIVLQLIPLPPAAHAMLAPEGSAFRAAMSVGYAPGAWAPLSLDPRTTRVTLMLALAAFGLHVAARRVGTREGRRLGRWIAWLALAAALLGLGGGTLFPDGRIYGFWRPLERGASPFGAIINRNHFAAWAIMAAVITLGVLAAHASRRRAHTPPARARVAALGDTRGLWLLFAAVVTVAAIVMTASRSGFAALVAASGAAMVLMRRRAGARAIAAAAIVAGLCLAAALSWARPDRLITRFDAPDSGMGVRQTIWQQSRGVARRYPVTGVGAGAFPAAMAYYQTGPRDVFFNHAHNQYLETAAEGGLLLGLPVIVLSAALIVRIGRRLREDRDSYFWLRVGSAAALAGLAVACLWETPFRTPATLMLAAVAAGLAAAEEQA